MSAQSGQINKWLPKLEAWLTAVHAHQPGKPDAAAKRIAGYSNQDLDLLTPYIQHVARLMAAGDTAGTDADAGARPVRSPIELEQLRRLAAQERARGDAAQLLRRGAMLHGDVMMLGLVPDAKPISRDGARREQAAKRPVLVIGVDGEHSGFAIAPRHWHVGRELLAAVPAAQRDEWMRRWFHATAAYQMMTSRWGDVRLHLLRAASVFPDDAHVEFDLGCLYEVRASPRVQAVLRSGRGFSADIGGTEENLETAERHFARAAELDPRHHEARLRLARVRIALGRAEAAVRGLDDIMNASVDPAVRYYVRLFLGEAQRALGQTKLAEQHYREAAALYPGAQAPHLALSVLAREAGDRKASMFALQHFLALPASDRARRDPWWLYYTGNGRRAATMVQAMWADAAGAATR